MPDSSKPAPLADNPYGENFRTMKDDGRRFRVVHNAVGAHTAGAVVSARELGPGAELPRLVKLGAIAELSASEIHDYEEAQTRPEGAAAATAAPEAPGPVVQPTGTGPIVKPSDLPAKAGK